MPKLANVFILNIFLDTIFSYAVPSEIEGKIKIGSIVEVPFGSSNKSNYGVVFDIDNYPSEKYEDNREEKAGLKKIISLTDIDFSYSPEIIKLAKWLHLKYFSNYMTIMRCIAPSSLFFTKNKLNNHLHKTERMIKLSKPVSEIGEIINIFSKRCPNQAKILQELLNHDLKSGIKYSQLSKSINNGASAVIKRLMCKGLIEIYENPVIKSVYDQSSFERTVAFHPTDEQTMVIDKIKFDIASKKYNVSLLRGVTGSGKTEVYLQLIEHVLKNGKQAIVLVPEISLTPQMIKRFVGRLGDKVAVWHSALSASEKYDQWQKIYKQEVSIVVGTRSAIFMPFNNIGIIVIDEEHETTYKSEHQLKYDTIEVAKFRAKHHKAVLLLASATPRVKSYYNAITKKYDLLEMHERYNKNLLPKIQIYDMRQELMDGNTTMFSKALKEEIEKKLFNKEQIILFLNRRGYSSSVICRECGYTVKCPTCLISMTYHKDINLVVCHSCGHKITNPVRCPSCKSKYIRYLGDGTQKIEEEISQLFPNSTYLRMDTDITKKKQSHKEILDKFHDDQVDILIGTQMITKGLDFPNVGLIGVMLADSSLNVGDYTAYERTFSLITQVCGRSGRGETRGRAIIQTYQPDHPVIQFAKDHDYLSFYHYELQLRKLENNPPFKDIFAVLIISKNPELPFEVLNKIKYKLKKSISSLVIYGPTPAPIFNVNGVFRVYISIKYPADDQIHYILNQIKNEYSKNTQIKIGIDVNPVNFM